MPTVSRTAVETVGTRKISNVGFLDVGTSSVENALAAGTSFIHGSNTGGGARQNLKEKPQGDTPTMVQATPPMEAQCKSPCGKATSNGVGSICDSRCSLLGESRPMYLEQACGAGNEEMYGSNCRQCYVDVDKALEEERFLAAMARAGDHDTRQHVIMCDNMRPPQSTRCSLQCTESPDTVSVMRRTIR